MGAVHQGGKLDLLLINHVTFHQAWMWPHYPSQNNSRWPLPIVIGKSCLHPIDVGFFFFLTWQMGILTANWQQGSQRMAWKLISAWRISGWAGMRLWHCSNSGGHRVREVPATDSQQGKRVSHMLFSQILVQDHLEVRRDIDQLSGYLPWYSRLTPASREFGEQDPAPGRTGWEVPMGEPKS